MRKNKAKDHASGTARSAKKSAKGWQRYGNNLCILCFANVFNPSKQTIQIGEHQHLLSLVYVSTIDQFFHDVRQVQRSLERICNVCQKLHVVSGLKHFNVLPGIAEDRAETLLELVTLFGELELK